MNLQSITKNIATVDDEMQFEMSRRYREIQDERLAILDGIIEQYVPVNADDYNHTETLETELFYKGYMLRFKTYLYVYEGEKKRIYIDDFEFFDPEGGCLILTDLEYNKLWKI